MTGPIYPQATRELAERRARLAPDTAKAFRAFSQSVFAEGAIPTRTKQLIAVADHVWEEETDRLPKHRGRKEHGSRADVSDFSPPCVRPLYSIGHSTRPVSEFIEILRASEVMRVVDIRRIPWSRRNSQFDMAVLPVTLGRAGLDYVHLAALGGHRVKGTHAEEGVNAAWENQSFRHYADYARTSPFREGLRELLEMASRHTCAIMCAEAVWWRCHRRIVSDHMLVQGVPVVHLLTRTTQMPASLTSFAVVDAYGNVSYPASPPSKSGTDSALAQDGLANALGPLR